MKTKTLCNILFDLLIVALILAAVMKLADLPNKVVYTIEFIQYVVFSVIAFVSGLITRRVNKLEEQLATLKENKPDSPKTEK